MTSDGEWQEGSTWEALIFACHRQLDNLTVLIDENGLQAFGSTSEVASMAPLAARISGFDADVREIDGHDPDALRDALNRPQKRLRIIILRTIKGARVAALENRLESHYLPLTTDQYVVALDEVGRP
jgi:transketolase